MMAQASSAMVSKNGDAGVKQPEFLQNSAGCVPAP